MYIDLLDVKGTRLFPLMYEYLITLNFKKSVNNTVAPTNQRYDSLAETRDYIMQSFNHGFKLYLINTPFPEIQFHNI